MMAKHWIEQRLDELDGASKAGLARAMEVAPARITEIIRGTRKIQAGELTAMSAYLQLSIDDILAHSEQSAAHLSVLHSGEGFRAIRVRGTVCAGQWSEAAELRAEDHITMYVPKAPPTHYPNLYGVKVEGPSMNQIYPEGTILYVVPLLDFDRSVGNEFFVIAQQVKHGEYETTVKQFITLDGRNWLYPRSNHPEHQAPIEIPQPDTWPDLKHDEDGIYIIGVVVGSFRAEIPL